MTWNLSAFADEAGNSCDEQIAALQRAGLNLIDIRFLETFNISELPLDIAQTAAEKLSAAGVSVQMFGSPIGKIDIADDLEIDIKKLRHLAALAPIFNCRSVRIFSYFNQSERAHEAWETESLQRLSTLKDEAQALGLVLYHENESHIFGDKCADVFTIASALRDDNFRMIFDFDNYNQNGENVWQNWQKLKNVTDAFHLKDSTPEGQHVVIGQGAGYAKEILSDALQSGWNGLLSLEPHLNHSGAVAATGPGGIANQEFQNMSEADSFHLAAQEATALLKEIGAQ